MTEALSDEIAMHRRQIDAVDEVIVRLLNERARATLEIKRARAEADGMIHPLVLDGEVVQHVRWIAREGSLGPDAMGRIFEIIIEEHRALQVPA